MSLFNWLIVDKDHFNEMKRKIFEYESDDPLIKMKKIVEVLDAGHLDKDSGAYQETISRCSLELITKYAKIAQLYSQSTFIKDAGEDVLNKMSDMKKCYLSGPKQIESKVKKK